MVVKDVIGISKTEVRVKTLGAAVGTAAVGATVVSAAAGVAVGIMELSSRVCLVSGCSFHREATSCSCWSRRSCAAGIIMSQVSSSFLRLREEEL